MREYTAISSLIVNYFLVRKVSSFKTSDKMRKLRRIGVFLYDIRAIVVGSIKFLYGAMITPRLAIKLYKL